MFTWLTSSEAKSASFDSLHHDAFEKLNKEIAELEKYFSDNIVQTKKTTTVSFNKKTTLVDNTESTSRITKASGGMAWTTGGEQAATQRVEPKSKFDETTGVPGLKERPGGVMWRPYFDQEQFEEEDDYACLVGLFSDMGDMEEEKKHTIDETQKKETIAVETTKSAPKKSAEKLTPFTTTETLIQEYDARTNTAKRAIQSCMHQLKEEALEVNQGKQSVSIQALKLTAKLKEMLENMKKVQIQREGNDLKLLQGKTARELNLLGQVKTGLSAAIEQYAKKATVSREAETQTERSSKIACK